MFTIELHYIDGNTVYVSCDDDTEQEARAYAKRMLATFERACARGDIPDDLVPWVCLKSGQSDPVFVS